MKSILALLVALFACASCEDRPESECEAWRHRAQARPIVGGITPDCEENGDFKHLQCHPGSNFCQCWQSDGSVVTQASTVIRHCDCILAQHENAKHPGAYHPECHNDGNYKAKQCGGSVHECWCVDEHGTKVTEPSNDVDSVHCQDHHEEHHAEPHVEPAGHDHKDEAHAHD